MDFGIGERYVYLEERRKWNKYFTRIDFTSGMMAFYDNERSELLRKEIFVRDCEFYDAVKMKNRPCTVQISPLSTDASQSHPRNKRPPPIFLSTDELRVSDELKVELEELNGSFEGIARRDVSGGCACIHNSIVSGGAAAVRLEHLPIKDWNKSDVLEWLRQVKLAPEAERQFQDNEIDGTILLEIDDQTLLNIGVRESAVQNIMTELNRLKRAGQFSVSRFLVKSKFERFPGFSSEATEFEDMIDSLCDSAKLKHKFLNTADLEAHTLDRPEGGAGGGGTISGARVHRLDYGEPVEQYREARIKIKIVVTEILHSDRAKSFRKLISPVVNAVIPALRNEFGFFHTAIIVGPWYLEWTDSELIIPKRMVSGRAIISADVDTLNVPKDGLREISDKISDVIVRWNTLYKYRNTPARGTAEYEGNCQDFVDDILHALGVSLEFGGALGDFIAKMRVSGKCVLEFTPCQEFREFFGISEKSWVFKTHQELDEFCVRIREQCLDIYTTFGSEWYLLKSFDRAFWLRHLKMPEDPRYIPLPPERRAIDQFQTGCPFMDPRATRSFV